MIKRRTLIAAVSGFAMLSGTAVAQERQAAPPPVLPSMKGETIVVAGATGRTGKVVVELLKAEGAKVRAFSRNIEKAKAEVPGVEWISADVKDAKSIKGIAKGADRMVIALGSNSFRDKENKPELVDNKGVALLTDEAKSAGVKHVVLVSSVSVTSAKPGKTDFENIMYNVMTSKLEGENYLRKSGVGYTVIRPVGLWDKPPAQYGIAIMGGDIPVPGAMIARADVAAIAVNALVNPEAKNKTISVFNISSPQIDSWKTGFAAIPKD
jgi:uncharacterized protein YbjT (DUF2867 family)